MRESSYDRLGADMVELAKSLKTARMQVARDPLSQESSDAMARLTENIRRFLADPLLKETHRLTAAQRAALSRQAQKASDTLRDILSVSEQLGDLGRGRAPWHTALADARGRFES